MKTNEEVVAEMMRYSPYGAMAQLFIIQAIADAAQKWSEIDPADIDSNGLINPESWVGTAKDIRRQLTEAGYMR